MTTMRKTSLLDSVIEVPIPPRVCAAVSALALEAASRSSTSIEENQEAMATAGANILSEVLPADAQDALGRLALASRTTILVLRQLAKLDAPPTPVNGFDRDELLAPQDIVLAGAMRLAGTEPCAFPFENQGRIARNVVANPIQHGKASSHGYDVELFWHQDNCGQPFEGEDLAGCKLPPMPKQLAFMGIRNDERVPTRILLVDDALRFLNSETIEILMKPIYRIGAPDSVASDGFGTLAIEDAPIIREEDGYHLMRYDPFLISTKEPSALLAHARLAIALSEATPSAIDITLGPGDLMIFKNDRLLHMRVAFVPADASRSRWLRRFYGRRRK